jgi:HEAT repeat protein
MRKVVASGITVASLMAALAGFESTAWAEPASAAPPAATPAAAAPKPKAATAKSAEQQRFDAALQKLASADPAAVQVGIDALTEQGGAAAEKALTDRVAAGLPPALIEPALRGLVKLKAKRSVPVVIELLEHRRSFVRSEALLALSQLDTRKPSPLQATFVAALGDPSSEVSRAAAEGLGRIGTKAALPALWSAYDKGVTRALTSIAELAGVESVEALVTRTQANGMELLEPVVDRMLARNALPSGAQVKLVRAMAETRSDGARQYLLKWLDRIKMQGQAQAQVKKELFDALKVLDAPAPATSATQEVAVRSSAAKKGGTP